MNRVDHIICMSQCVLEPRNTREDAAWLYADAIGDDSQGTEVDWHALNAEILKRWSRAGLVYIKKRAWKILREPIIPRAAQPKVRTDQVQALDCEGVLNDMGWQVKPSKPVPAPRAAPGPLKPKAVQP